MKKDLIVFLLFILLCYNQTRAQSPTNNYSPEGYSLVISGKLALVHGEYEEAYDKFTEAWMEYDFIPALVYIGACEELGLGCDRNLEDADSYYMEGAKNWNLDCIAAIQRINTTGHWKKSDRAAYILMIKKTVQYLISGGTVGTFSNPQMNSDVDHSCRACNNTGICNGCHGTGYAYGTTRCNMCHGSGRCMNCGGRGSH